MNSKMETLWEMDLHKQNFHNKCCSRERSIVITHDESGPKKVLTHYFIKQQSLWCYDQAFRIRPFKIVKAKENLEPDDFFKTPERRHIVKNKFQIVWDWNSFTYLPTPIHIQIQLQPTSLARFRSRCVKPPCFDSSGSELSVGTTGSKNPWGFSCAH